jgi:biofilm protein TabA
MILDLLAHASWYHPMHPRLKPAFAWLHEQDFTKLADGSYPIDGEVIRAIVESGTTAAPASRKYESHQRFLDIQVPISGGERMGWCPAAGIQPGEQAGPDLWFHSEPASAQLLTVMPGSFAIFAPLEAHKPCCTAFDKPAPFRKCVVKVAWT